MQADDLVDTAFPQLELKDEVYAQGLLELLLGFLNLDKSILEDPFQPQQYAQSLNQFVNSSGDKETKDIADLLTAVIQKQTNGLNYEQQDIEKVRDIIEDVLKQIQSKVDARLDLNKPLSGNTVSV